MLEALFVELPAEGNTFGMQELRGAEHSKRTGSSVLRRARLRQPQMTEKMIYPRLYSVSEEIRLTIRFVPSLAGLLRFRACRTVTLHISVLQNHGFVLSEPSVHWSRARSKPLENPFKTPKRQNGKEHAERIKVIHASQNLLGILTLRLRVEQ